jgi:16S rRNA (cytidine1402-2'-O)-methyltransferase
VESGLYVVATPIGNLEDISRRAVQVLENADLVAAEDTRHSQKLLQHLGLDTRMTAYHDHSDERAVERIVARIAQGAAVALVSDAGTPMISDPGYRLVRAVQDAGQRVVPVPGACAAIAALSAGGLPTDRFRFEGFPPAKAGARQRCFEALAGESATLVFYEAPHRLAASLADMARVFGGDREAVLAREISKAFETLRRDTLDALSAFVAADSNQQKGEVVLLVAGVRRNEAQLDEETARLLTLLARELPAKRAAALVAEHTGLRRKDLYNFLLAQKDEGRR